MNLWKAILLGALQGLTEFLPVSSSGHLAIFSQIFGLEMDDSLYFDILLHLGTLVAICIVFYREVWHLIREFFMIVATCLANLIIWFRHRRGDLERDYLPVITSGYRKMVVMIILSTIPTGILGLAGKKVVAWATGTLWAVGVCLMITALLLFIADRCDRGTTRIKNARYSSAFFIGVGQGIATMPGISRSGTTITVAMMLGWDKQTAVRYSFLMSLPAVLGAVVLDLKDLSGETAVASDMGFYAVGMVAAAVTGYAALRWMLHLVKNKKYTGFAVYCAALGLLAVAFGIINVI